MTTLRQFICLFCVLVAGGCSHVPGVGADSAGFMQNSKQQTAHFQKTAHTNTGKDLATDYLLDSGDSLRIIVHEQRALSGLYAVDGGGSIAMPLIGSIKARGLTTKKLSARITATLNASYLKDPKVAVEIAQYRPFFILGEVRNAGQFPYVNGMTVQTAVAIAGGYSPRADEMVAKVTRRIEGQTITERVNADYAIQPGDTVYIEERFL